MPVAVPTVDVSVNVALWVGLSAVPPLKQIELPCGVAVHVDPLDDDAVNGAPAVKPAGGVISTDPRVSTPATALPVLVNVKVSTTVLPAMTVLGDNVAEYDASPAAAAGPASVTTASAPAVLTVATAATNERFLLLTNFPPSTGGRVGHVNS